MAMSALIFVWRQRMRIYYGLSALIFVWWRRNRFTMAMSALIFVWWRRKEIYYSYVCIDICLEEDGDLLWLCLH